MVHQHDHEPSKWKQLTIYISESDSWQHQPLHQTLLGIDRKQRTTGVTVMRAISGYGKHGIMVFFVL